MKNLNVELSFYLVRSQDGKWFRAKGMRGYGDSWVDDPQKARVYSKIGPARACVTWWTNQYPKYGIPDIVEVTTTNGVILDENERVTKAVQKIKTDKKQREINSRQYRFNRAQEKLREAQNELNELKL